jgi:hypothetical protein
MYKFPFAPFLNLTVTDLMYAPKKPSVCDKSYYTKHAYILEEKNVFESLSSIMETLLAAAYGVEDVMIFVT